MYSTPADIARYVSALQRIGADEHGSVLKPDTLVSMLQPHFRLDPLTPGMGFAFELGEESGHGTASRSISAKGSLRAGKEPTRTTQMRRALPPQPQHPATGGALNDAAATGRDARPEQEASCQSTRGGDSRAPTPDPRHTPPAQP